MFGKRKKPGEEYSRETREPVAAWAREQGWYVADPPDEPPPYPQHLLAPGLHPKRCDLVVGDIGQQGFTAQSWEVELAHLGGFPFSGRHHALVTAARDNLPQMIGVAKDNFGDASFYVPKELAVGPLDMSGPLALMGGDPEALQRLAPLTAAIESTGVWLILTPGSVSFHGPGEPDLEQLELRLRLSRAIAAAFGAQLG